MKDLITSDLHFFHDNILKFCKDTRPFNSKSHMVEMLIHEWNSKVDVNDNIYHLGDFSFGKYDDTLKVLNSLQGRIHLIKGNHDSSGVWKSLMRDTTANVVWFKDYHELKYKPKNVLVTMSHYPFEVWRDSHKGSVSLHGHCHGSMPQQGRRVDVGYDKQGSIVELDKVIDEALSYKPHTPDSHKGGYVNENF